jgi:hypothetical protein
MGSANSGIGKQTNYKGTTDDITTGRIVEGVEIKGTTNDMSTRETTKGAKAGI